MEARWAHGKEREAGQWSERCKVLERAIVAARREVEALRGGEVQEAVDSLRAFLRWPTGHDLTPDEEVTYSFDRGSEIYDHLVKVLDALGAMKHRATKE